MSPRDKKLPADLRALRGQRVTVESVDVVEDVDGVPGWVKVDQELATVVISPLLMTPRRPEATTQPEPIGGER